MRLLLLLLAAAAASAQPLHQADQGDQPATAGADNATLTTQQPPGNSSDELPPLLVDALMQLAVDLSRVAMEIHRSGGSRTVSSWRLGDSGDASLLLTFHRTAEAAAASMTPEGRVSQLMSLLASAWTNAGSREVSGRAMDYESSAEASLSEALPLAIKPLPPPVVPHLDPISMPPDHAEQGSSKEKAQGSHPAAEKQQSKKAGEVAHRSGEVSRTLVAMTSDKEDPYGLHFLIRFLEAIHNLVRVAKKLVVSLGSLQEAGTGDGGDGDGGGGRDVSSVDALKNALESRPDLAKKVSSLMVAHELIKAKKKDRGR